MQFAIYDRKLIIKHNYFHLSKKEEKEIKSYLSKKKKKKKKGREGKGRKEFILFIYLSSFFLGIHFLESKWLCFL